MRLRSSAELQEQPFDAPSPCRNRRYQLLTLHGSSLDVPWSPPIRIENSGANASHDLVLVKVQVARTCASSPVTDAADARPLQSARTVQLAPSGIAGAARASASTLPSNKVRKESPVSAAKICYAAIGVLVRGGRSIRAGMCPVKGDEEDCRSWFAGSSPAVKTMTGGGA